MLMISPLVLMIVLRRSILLRALSELHIYEVSILHTLIKLLIAIRLHVYADVI